MALFFDILNIVLPVFVVIALGWLLRRIGLIDAPFLQMTNQLVYYVCLPLLLFYKIGTADFGINFNGRLVVASIATVAITFLISYAYTVARGYPAAQRGVFSQGSFRGNIAYIGLAIAMNAYGESGLTRAAILMGFLVPFLNLFAILALLWPHRGNTGQRGMTFWVRQFALNPLILASFLGIAWSFFELPIPVLFDRSLKIATGMALPLALLAIGGSFSLEKLRGDLFTASLASGAKLVWMPLLAALLLIGLGVDGMDLAIGVLIAGTPAATANYIMAHQLHGDAELAGGIVMLSTLLSAVTYTIALLLLRSQGL
ncbi:MAG: AEC family transporter [Desulfuromonadales bacterium]|nr:AEC family transporter [Desulfuromonadales bacterium]